MIPNRAPEMPSAIPVKQAFVSSYSCNKETGVHIVPRHTAYFRREVFESFKTMFDAMALLGLFPCRESPSRVKWILHRCFRFVVNFGLWFTVIGLFHGVLESPLDQKFFQITCACLVLSLTLIHSLLLVKVRTQRVNFICDSMLQCIKTQKQLNHSLAMLTKIKTLALVVGIIGNSVVMGLGVALTDFLPSVLPMWRRILPVDGVLVKAGFLIFIFLPLTAAWAFSLVALSAPSLVLARRYSLLNRFLAESPLDGGIKQHNRIKDCIDKCLELNRDIDCINAQLSSLWFTTSIAYVVPVPLCMVEIISFDPAQPLSVLKLFWAIALFLYALFSVLPPAFANKWSRDVLCKVGYLLGNPLDHLETSYTLVAIRITLDSARSELKIANLVNITFGLIAQVGYSLVSVIIVLVNISTLLSCEDA